MSDQLEFFLREQISEADTLNAAEQECARLMFGERAALVFTFDMTVGGYHTAWQEMTTDRTREWEARYKPAMDACFEQLKKLDSRDRKGRAPVKREIARLQCLSGIAQQLATREYDNAVATLDEQLLQMWNKRKPRPTELQIEHAHSEFWEDITEIRRATDGGLWDWTLQDVADTNIIAQTDRHESIEDNPEFRKTLIRARKRGTGKIELTRSECYFGHGFIARIAAMEGEKIAA